MSENFERVTNIWVDDDVIEIFVTEQIWMETHQRWWSQASVLHCYSKAVCGGDCGESTIFWALLVQISTHYTVLFINSIASDVQLAAEPLNFFEIFNFDTWHFFGCRSAHVDCDRLFNTQNEPWIQNRLWRVIWCRIPLSDVILTVI